MSAGRSCPLSYRYPPSSFRREADVETDVLYVVGGLYGNEFALRSVLDMFAAERGPKHIVFNGDFNWFNVDDDSFMRLNETVLSFDAIRGNVETEFDPRLPAGGAGDCGCAYPDWVDDEVVSFSNAIMQRLAATAARFPDISRRLAALPMHRRIDVNGEAVGIVHGDAQSLSGWGFAAEHLTDPAAQRLAQRWFDAAGVRIFACTHTCTPVFMRLPDTSGRQCLIANNGAAGMPNFQHMPAGLLTRIARQPSAPGVALYATEIGGVTVEAVPILFDNQQWQQSFLTQWPAGSAAHASYWQRITAGPSYRVEQAMVTARP